MLSRIGLDKFGGCFETDSADFTDTQFFQIFAEIFSHENGYHIYLTIWFGSSLDAIDSSLLLDKDYGCTGVNQTRPAANTVYTCWITEYVIKVIITSFGIKSKYAPNITSSPLLFHNIFHTGHYYYCCINCNVIAHKPWQMETCAIATDEKASENKTDVQVKQMDEKKVKQKSKKKKKTWLTFA